MNVVSPTTQHLHSYDRSHYDTPASVRECACAECNKMRRAYGAAPKRWVYRTQIDYVSGTTSRYRAAV